MGPMSRRELHEDPDDVDGDDEPEEGDVTDEQRSEDYGVESGEELC